MWTRYFPAIKKVNQLLNEKAIGDVILLRGTFGLQTTSSSNPRMTEPNLGGGALMDLGVYLVSFAYMIFKQSPTKIYSSADTKNSVDYQTSILFSYPQGQAQVTCGINSGFYDNEMNIIGTNGTIKIKRSFHCPTSIVVTIGEKVENFDFPLPEHDSKLFNYTNSIGLGYEAQAVQEAWKSGKYETDEISLEESLKIMTTLDTIRSHIGVTYPNEQRMSFLGTCQ